MRVLLFIFISANLFSQDTIVLRTKEIKAVKVQEIGINQIKYHRFDNMDGPLFVVDKTEIDYIKYPSGKIDFFETAIVDDAKDKTSPTQQSAGQSAVATKPEQNSLITTKNKKIDIRVKKLFYEDKILTDEKLLKLILEYPIAAKKARMLEVYVVRDLKKTKRRQVVGLNMLMWGIPTTFAYLIGAPFGISGAIMMTKNKNKYNSIRLEIAKIYNSPE